MWVVIVVAAVVGWTDTDADVDGWGQDAQRPVVFVGKGFGGLIVKQVGANAM